jgi:hypothetical protein
MFTPFHADMEPLPTSDQKYNLRWPDYHTSVLSSFRYLTAGSSHRHFL